MNHTVVSCQLSVVSCLLALALLTGCQAPPERVVYNTLSVTKTAVEGAMRTAADLLVAGHLEQVKWTDLAATYDYEFTPAFQTAVTLARQDYNAITPARVEVLANQIINTVAAIAAHNRRN